MPRVPNEVMSAAPNGVMSVMMPPPQRPPHSERAMKRLLMMAYYEPLLSPPRWRVAAGEWHEVTHPKCPRFRWTCAWSAPIERP